MNSIFRFFGSIIKILTNHEKKYYFNNIYYLLFAALLDAICLVLLAPVLNVLTSHEPIKYHRYWSKIYHFFRFDEQEYFLLLLITIVFFVYLIKNWITILILKRQGKIAHQIAGRISRDMMRSLLSNPSNFIKNPDTAEHITSTHYIPSNFATGILLPFGIFVSEIVLMGILLLGILIFKPILFLMVSFSMIPVVIIIFRRLKKKMHDLGNIRNLYAIKGNETLLEYYTAYPELRHPEHIIWAERNYTAHQKFVNESDSDLYTYASVPPRILELAAIGILGVVIFTFIILSIPEAVLLYTLSLFAAIAFRMIPAFNRLSQSMLKLRNYEYTTRSIEKYLPFKIPDIAIIPEEPIQSVAIKNLYYTYDKNNYILENLNIEFHFGNVYAITGESGSGKTTFLHILSGLLKPEKGELLYNNKPKNWDEIMYYCSLCRQETSVLNLTLDENILLGYTHEKNNNKRLHIIKEICGLTSVPFQSMTQPGEFGTNISGGQRQRIGLARALYHPSPILLLDESTSWLEEEMGIEIISRVILFCKNENRIPIIVSHNLRVTELCDVKYKISNKTIYKI